MTCVYPVTLGELTFCDIGSIHSEDDVVNHLNGGHVNHLNGGHVNHLNGSHVHVGPLQVGRVVANGQLVSLRPVETSQGVTWDRPHNGQYDSHRDFVYNYIAVKSWEVVGWWIDLLEY